MTLGVATGARLNANANLDRDLDRIAALHAPAVRWYADWKRCEPQLGSGQYDWSEPDAIIQGCVDRGLKICLGISGRADGHVFDYTGAVEPWARAVTSRYWPSGIVIGFEGANEANLIKADAHPTAARYTAYQAELYAGAKAGAPDAPVGTGGIIGSSDVLEQLYEAGCGAFFDMVCWHPYCRPISPTESMRLGHGGWDALIKARHVMVANGDRHKQMWVTEFGTNTGGPEACTEKQQADDLHDAVHRFRTHPWAGPFFNFCGWDVSPGKQKGDFMGLYRPDGSEKPAAQTFRELAAK